MVLNLRNFCPTRVEKFSNSPFKGLSFPLADKRVTHFSPLPGFETQTYLGNIAGSVLDHHNKASLAIKRVVISLLTEGLALIL